PHRAEVLNKELGIFTFRDLLHYYPFRYNDRSVFYKINQIQPAANIGVQFIARLMHFSVQGERQSRRLVATVKDDTGVAQLVWFKGIKWVEKSLIIGKVYVIYGNPGLFSNQISISHPEIEPYSKLHSSSNTVRFQPVYPSTEKLKKLS